MNNIGVILILDKSKIGWLLKSTIYDVDETR